MYCGQLYGLVLFKQRFAACIFIAVCVSVSPMQQRFCFAGGSPLSEKWGSGVVLRNNPHRGVSGEHGRGSSQEIQAKRLLQLSVSENNDGESK